MTNSDPDLPGDETFIPAPPVVAQERTIRCGWCPTDGSGKRCIACGGPHRAISLAMTIPPAAQAAHHHNRLRYAELAALRLGLPNRYHESRYR